MKTRLTITGLITALFLSALPATSVAHGDGFNDVVKLIEQFYHVKHQSIPLLARAGSAKHLAQQSGGEAVRVNRTSDYGAGLAKIIGNLTARYSLGFTLSEQEKDDGRMHELAITVKALDAKGKERKLEVSSRRGYFMPKCDTEAAANQ